MSRPKTWYEFHASKFEADTAHLTCEEVGAYIRLLDFHFLHGSIPDDIDRLRSILRETKQKTRKLWSVLESFFYKENGCFYQKRMVATIAKATEKSKKSTEAANKRWHANAYPNAYANADTVTDTVTKTVKKEREKEKPAPRKTRLPSDWQPSEKLINYCRDKRPDLDPTTTFDNAKDYYLSHGKTMADWDRAMMRWVRNERTTQPGTRQHALSATERSDQKEREAARALGITL